MRKVISDYAQPPMRYLTHPPMLDLDEVSFISFIEPTVFPSYVSFSEGSPLAKRDLIPKI